jgi:TolB protein
VDLQAVGCENAVRRITVAVGITLALGAAGCSEKNSSGPDGISGPSRPTGSPTSTPTGNIAISSVTTTATSFDLDPDGYQVIIDTRPPRFLGVNATVIVSNLDVASHAVTLKGLSENCSVSGTPNRQVDVIAGGTATVAFEIACARLPEVEVAGELAFVSERDGNSEIYSIDKDGHEIRLTNNPAEDIDPAWSPDGKRIAFVSDRDGISAIYTMDADGSNVVRRTTDGRFTSSPAWSPDGRKIAYSTVLDGQFGIHVVDIDGDASHSNHVGFDRGWNAYPAWSPDGKRIAFVSDWRAYDFVYDLYSMNADGSDITPLVLGPFFWPDNTYYFQPAWSPNGSKIAMVVCTYAWDNCYPQSSIAVANADGSNLVTLIGAGGFSRPTWSPDGSVIAYSVMQCRDCSGTIRFVTPDGKRGRVEIANAHSPSWRPVGK